MANIFNTLYIDYIKPIDKYITTIILVIIFTVAGYIGYNWFAKPTIEPVSYTHLTLPTILLV